MIMKTHPMKGYKIMSQIPAMKEFLPGMYMHHEMVNGLGYPQGPLAWGDSLDPRRLLTILERMVSVTNDPRYRPSPWLRRRAQLGLSLRLDEPSAV